MSYRIVRHHDLAKGFDGYNWIECPDSHWPQGGYFDGRGRQFATVYSDKSVAEARAKEVGGDVLPM